MAITTKAELGRTHTFSASFVDSSTGIPLVPVSDPVVTITGPDPSQTGATPIPAITLAQGLASSVLIPAGTWEFDWLAPDNSVIAEGYTVTWSFITSTDTVSYSENFKVIAATGGASAGGGGASSVFDGVMTNVPAQRVIDSHFSSGNLWTSTAMGSRSTGSMTIPTGRAVRFWDSDLSKVLSLGNNFLYFLRSVIDELITEFFIDDNGTEFGNHVIMKDTKIRTADLSNTKGDFEGVTIEEDCVLGSHCEINFVRSHFHKKMVTAADSVVRFTDCTVSASTVEGLSATNCRIEWNGTNYETDTDQGIVVINGHFSMNGGQIVVRQPGSVGLSLQNSEARVVNVDNIFGVDCNVQATGGSRIRSYNTNYTVAGPDHSTVFCFEDSVGHFIGDGTNSIIGAEYCLRATNSKVSVTGYKDFVANNVTNLVVESNSDITIRNVENFTTGGTLNGALTDSRLELRSVNLLTCPANNFEATGSVLRLNSVTEIEAGTNNFVLTGGRLRLADSDTITAGTNNFTVTNGRLEASRISTLDAGTNTIVGTSSTITLRSTTEVTSGTTALVLDGCKTRVVDLTTLSTGADGIISTNNVLLRIDRLNSLEAAAKGLVVYSGEFYLHTLGSASTGDTFIEATGLEFYWSKVTQLDAGLHGFSLTDCRGRWSEFGSLLTAGHGFVLSGSLVNGRVLTSLLSAMDNFNASSDSQLVLRSLDSLTATQNNWALTGGSTLDLEEVTAAVATQNNFSLVGSTAKASRLPLLTATQNNFSLTDASAVTVRHITSMAASQNCFLVNASDLVARDIASAVPALSFVSQTGGSVDCSLVTSVVTGTDGNVQTGGSARYSSIGSFAAGTNGHMQAGGFASYDLIDSLSAGSNGFGVTDGSLNVSQASSVSAGSAAVSATGSSVLVNRCPSLSGATSLTGTNSSSITIRASSLPDLVSLVDSSLTVESVTGADTWTMESSGLLVSASLLNEIVASLGSSVIANASTLTTVGMEDGSALVANGSTVSSLSLDTDCGLSGNGSTISSATIAADSGAVCAGCGGTIDLSAGSGIVLAGGATTASVASSGAVSLGADNTVSGCCGTWSDGVVLCTDLKVLERSSIEIHAKAPLITDAAARIDHTQSSC